MKKLSFIFLMFWVFMLNFQVKAQMPVSEKDLVGSTFEIQFGTESYYKVTFKKHKVAELTIYATDKKGNMVYIPGRAVWDMSGDKVTLVSEWEGFRGLISENSNLSRYPTTGLVLVGCQVTRATGKDLTMTSPYMNSGHVSDAEFEATIKNKTAFRQTMKLKKI